LQRRPVSNIAWLTRKTKLSAPTVGKALEGLTRLGIVRETTGRQRNRVFVYGRYLDLLNRGTEAA
jgi:DNA-binding transcriptional ArsR family regulator